MSSNVQRPLLSMLIAALFLCVTIAPVATADSHVPNHSIVVDWGADEEFNQVHSYRFVFDNALNSTSSEFSASAVHSSSEGSILSSLNQTSSEMQFIDDRTLRMEMPDVLSFGDTVSIATYWDGVASGLEREVQATVWNQPLADHSVTISTDWNLNHSYDDENGSQYYLLEFGGRGWQERQGDVLNAWELGDGMVTINEISENDSTWLNLTLEEIWRNETTVDGVLQSQFFNARGWGSMVVEFSDADMDNMRVIVGVTNAQFNRSTVDGVISEGTTIEASGQLNATNQDEDGELWLNGTVSVFYFERYESGGVILHDLAQFEGYAEMELVDGDNRFDIDISTIEMYEEWLNGERIGQRESIQGAGTFGFQTQDEDDADVTINGTVYDLRETTVDGMKTDQYFHMDGTFSGDVDGTFGAITNIETSGNWENHNGTSYPVNIILEENWFNLSGSGGFGFDNAGQSHNKTWNYEVPYKEWENKTIYRKWESTGFDNDRGDEYPENSPIENDPTPPETEDGLGEVNLSRETGLSPVSLQPGDMVSLVGSELVMMDLEAQSIKTSVKDGREFNVTDWSGVYYNRNGSITDGVANGEVINKGPLSGLISSVQRYFAIPAVNEEYAVFTESQFLERISYPAVVSEGENNDPEIVSISLREGLVNEGGTISHLEVEIEDEDWNVVSVQVDLSSLGLAVVELSDEGLNGDLTIHDDVWTVPLSVSGIMHGELSVQATVTDSWGASDVVQAEITVFNHAPRLFEWEHAPSLAHRGEILIVNAEVFDGNGVARVAVDMRNHGGELHDLVQLVDLLWTGQVPIPVGMSPGEQVLKVYLEDADGSSITVSSTQSTGSHYLAGPDDEALRLEVMNQGPDLSSPDIEPSEVSQVENVGEEETYLVTISVDDLDGVRWVKVKLGALAAIGQQDTYLLMYDNGQNGDVTAGDGIYSIEFESRRGVPIGPHPISFKAEDEYGAVGNNDDFIIKVVESESGNFDTDEVLGFAGQPEVIIGIIIGIVVIIALAVGIVMLRKRAASKDDPWAASKAEDPWGNQ